MKIKITCPCYATFEVNSKLSYHAPGITCPNCGKRLPSEASSVLMNLIDDSKELAKILSKDQAKYSFKISDRLVNQ